MKENLEQEIAKLLGKFERASFLNGIEDFVRLLGSGRSEASGESVRDPTGSLRGRCRRACTATRSSNSFPTGFATVRLDGSPCGRSLAHLEKLVGAQTLRPSLLEGCGDASRASYSLAAREARFAP